MNKFMSAIRAMLQTTQSAWSLRRHDGRGSATELETQLLLPGGCCSEMRGGAWEAARATSGRPTP